MNFVCGKSTLCTCFSAPPSFFLHPSHPYRPSSFIRCRSRSSFVRSSTVTEICALGRVGAVIDNILLGDKYSIFQIIDIS